MIAIRSLRKQPTPKEIVLPATVVDKSNYQPLDMPAELPEVELGHRSRSVDALLCRAVLEGCRMPLAGGLRLESELFGAGCALEDMKIGVQNFLKNGPKAKAEFVHR